jgi:nitroreductase
MSPTARNSQQWRFVIVRDPQKIAELSDAAKRIAGAAGGGAQKPAPAFAPALPPSLFYGAPLLILVVTNEKRERWAQVDAGIAAQSMLLAAHSLGLGSCFIGLARPLNDDPALLESLGVPKGWSITAPLIFGYPAERKEAPKRTFEDKILKRFE